MDWRDQGALLSVRRQGETSAIIEVFTEAHGRHAGVVRGGASRRIAPLLQPGAQLDLEWRARLDAHLGAFRIEPLRSRAAGVLGDRAALAGLNAICALLAYALPEREPHARLYARTITLLDALDTPGWPRLYLMWEMRLLDETGFGLDLSCCAVTGAAEGLAYVSPRTGRAVSRAGAGEWADRLLPLPACLIDPSARATPAEVVAGLKTTGYFLAGRLAPALGERPLPEARTRLVGALSRDLPGV